jgi:leucyl aminopeptidase
LGPEVIPFYTHDESLADALQRQSKSVYDPLWQMPLWHGYDGWLSSSIADVNHISSSPMAGSITAALFLSRFVPDDISWAHFDIYGWNIKARAGRPIGGEAHALRAAYAMIEERYGQAQ